MKSNDPTFLPQRLHLKWKQEHVLASKRQGQKTSDFPELQFFFFSLNCQKVSLFYSLVLPGNRKLPSAAAGKLFMSQKSYLASTLWVFRECVSQPGGKRDSLFHGCKTLKDLHPKDDCPMHKVTLQICACPVVFSSSFCCSYRQNFDLDNK